MGCVFILWHSLSLPYNYFVVTSLIGGTQYCGTIHSQASGYPITRSAKWTTSLDTDDRYNEILRLKGQNKCPSLHFYKLNHYLNMMEARLIYSETECGRRFERVFHFRTGHHIGCLYLHRLRHQPLTAIGRFFTRILNW